MRSTYQNAGTLARRVSSLPQRDLVDRSGFVEHARDEVPPPSRPALIVLTYRLADQRPAALRRRRGCRPGLLVRRMPPTWRAPTLEPVNGSSGTCSAAT